MSLNEKWYTSNSIPIFIILNVSYYAPLWNTEHKKMKDISKKMEEYQLLFGCMYLPFFNRTENSNEQLERCLSLTFNNKTSTKNEEKE